MTNPREQELEALRARVESLEAQLRALGHEPISSESETLGEDATTDEVPAEPNRLKLDEYIRYGRQMILPGFGLPSQLALRDASVLVVGAGGLGCPALMYLVSAGVGKLTIVDHDSVELSNLHRQVLHGVDMVGKPKVESAKRALHRINPSVEITTYCTSLTSLTLSRVFAPNVHFHMALDCSDTPSTRYLLSDVTARLGIPLISGAAQRTDGQLVVYNLPPPAASESMDTKSTTNHVPGNQGSAAANSANPTGPCMRCVFPSVSRTGAGAERCSDVGVLGPVVGVIGVLMALEAIKILTKFGVEECQSHTPSMLLFTALSPRPFKTIKLRPRQPTCQGCSGPPLDALSQNQSVLKFLDEVASLENGYNEFCGELADPILTGARQEEPKTRVSASVLKEALRSVPADPAASVVIIDTRPPTEFGICALPESTNVPLTQLLKTPERYLFPSARTFVVCRLGNDSQIAARALRNALKAKEDLVVSNADEDKVLRGTALEDLHQIVDVIGGLRAWAQEVDPLFPIY